VAQDPYVIAVDFGSNSIKLAVAKDTLDESNKIQILALVEKKSAGIRRGVITNMTEATESLIEVVTQAESIIGLPVRRAVFGINGSGISYTNSDGLVVNSRPDGEIQESDIQRVMQDSLTKAFGIDESEILHIIPKNFKIDNQGGIRYPVGMIGNKLECSTLIISMETSYLRNFAKVVSQASIDMTNQIFMPLASGEFVLSNMQKKSGSILIDIGSTTTSYIVWEDEEIFTTGTIPIGSEHITADLAVGLQTTIEMAEEVKRQHLNLSNEKDENELERIEMYNPDLQKNEVFETSEIRAYAKPRVEEIFAYINKKLRKAGKQGKLAGGGVLVGGGSSLNGAIDVAKSILKIPMFQFKFDKSKIDFVPDYDGDLAFINAISLIAYHLKHEGDMDFGNQGFSGQNRSRESNQGGGFLGFIRKISPFS